MCVCIYMCVYIYIYIYIYVCVCVCVCVYIYIFFLNLSFLTTEWLLPPPPLREREREGEGGGLLIYFNLNTKLFTWIVWRIWVWIFKYCVPDTKESYVLVMKVFWYFWYEWKIVSLFFEHLVVFCNLGTCRSNWV